MVYHIFTCGIRDTRGQTGGGCGHELPRHVYVAKLGF